MGGGGRRGLGAPPAVAAPTAPCSGTPIGSRNLRPGRVEDIPDDNPCSTSRSSRPRRTSGAGGVAHRDRVGEGLCMGSRCSAHAAATHGGSEPPTARHVLATRCALARSAPTGRASYGAPKQMLGDVWERTSSPLRPWPGSHPDDLPVVHRAVLRRQWGWRLQGFARRFLGRQPGHPAAQLPQLGPFDPAPDLPVCAWPIA